MGLKAGWQGLWGKNTVEKPRDPRNNHKFTDEDREYGQEIRQIRFEIKRAQEKARLLEAKRDLQEIQNELSNYDEDGEEEDEMTKYMPLIAPLLAKMNGGQAQSPPMTSPQTHSVQKSPTISTGTSITDDEIRGYLKQQQPQHIVMAKSLPKTLLFRQVRQKLPLTDEECERVYKILMTEF